MRFELDPPITFSQLGQRARNEDFVYPVDEQSRLFLVCDGIGGWEKGEVASELVAGAVARYFEVHSHGEATDAALSGALSWAYDALSDYLKRQLTVSRLGSTLALLYLGPTGATVAHMGDSRVYHLRGGEILHCTRDHKYVQELVAEGIITSEQARVHPRRHTLSRAIRAESNQFPPRMDQLERTLITDVRAGDAFFLCTDGVLEQVDDSQLSQFWAESTTARQLVEQILTQCEGNTKDNYSGCVVAVRQVRKQ